MQKAEPPRYEVALAVTPPWPSRWRSYFANAGLLRHQSSQQLHANEQRPPFAKRTRELPLLFSALQLSLLPPSSLPFSTLARMPVTASCRKDISLRRVSSEAAALGATMRIPSLLATLTTVTAHGSGAWLDLKHHRADSAYSGMRVRAHPARNPCAHERVFHLRFAGVLITGRSMYRSSSTACRSSGRTTENRGTPSQATAMALV